MNLEIGLYRFEKIEVEDRIYPKFLKRGILTLEQSGYNYVAVSVATY